MLLLFNRQAVAQAFVKCHKELTSLRLHGTLRKEDRFQKTDSYHNHQPQGEVCGNITEQKYTIKT